MAIFDEPSRKPLPQPALEDARHAAGKGLVSMIPFIGGPGAELVGLLTSPVEARRDAWLEDLERRLRELEQKAAGFRFEDLGRNEQFVSATLHATQLALRTHQAEKREALRNAVLNVAVRKHLPSDDLQLVFLNLVDRFTPWHLRVLEFFRDPYACYELAHGAKLSRFDFSHASPAGVLEKTFTELGSDQPFCRQIVKDLEAAGLLGSSQQHLRFSESWFDEGKTHDGALMKRTTSMGDAFLDFIAPVEP
jgi:hypothetical protein